MTHTPVRRSGRPRPAVRMRLRVGTLMVVVALNAAGCSTTEPPPTTTPTTTPTVPTVTQSSTPTTAQSSTPTTAPTPPTAEQARRLRRELVGMGRRDQGQEPADGETDADRIARLGRLLDRFGWPRRQDVGTRAGDAAWLVAQHADLDPDFQRRALALLRAAVRRGEASPGNLAYLADRVAVAAGRPQRYGTQVRCRARGPVLSTRLARPDAIGRLRRTAGLDPLADYLTQMTSVCAQGS